MNAVESLQQEESRQEYLSQLKFKPQLIKNVLQEHKTCQKRIKHLGERQLGPGLRIFLWGLRLYVFFMIVVVVINVSHSAH